MGHIGDKNRDILAFDGWKQEKCIPIYLVLAMFDQGNISGWMLIASGTG